MATEIRNLYGLAYTPLFWVLPRAVRPYHGTWLITRLAWKSRLFIPFGGHLSLARAGLHLKYFLYQGHSNTLAKYFFLGLNVYVVHVKFPVTSLVFREMAEDVWVLIFVLSHVNLPRLPKRVIVTKPRRKSVDPLLFFC